MDAIYQEPNAMRVCVCVCVGIQSRRTRSEFIGFMTDQLLGADDNECVFAYAHALIGDPPISDGAKHEIIRAFYRD